MNSRPTPPRFLVVDYHKDSRFLLVKCLLRKFPNSVIIEEEGGEAAIETVRRGGLTAIVTHRTREYFGTELVEKFRQVDEHVPIVMVSGIERTAPALKAGADRFMLYDEWLRIGTLVKELLDASRPCKVVHVDVAPNGPDKAGA